jgi:hypothetical protein
MLSRDIPKRRFLFEAPAGSGKTVVIAFAAMQFIGRDWPSGTRVLTITHGVNALQYALVKELDEQMSEMTSRGLHIEKIAVSDESECVIYECANKTKSITACTIDYILRTLLDADGTFALRGVRGVFEFDVVLVDEGHHVFNFMDKSHIQGQHELREKERISEEIEKVIKANSLYAIFHDDSCQSPLNGPPCYPGDLAVQLYTMHSALRMPSRVRDASVPFARHLESQNESVVKFFSVHEHAILGVDVWYENVAIDPAIVEALQPQRELPPGRLMLIKSFEPHIENAYANSIKLVFQKLRDRRLIGKCLRIAVLFPGTLPRDVLERIRRECLNGDDCIPATVAAEIDHFNQKKDAQLDVTWTWAENYTGMECDIVIMTGFHHPVNMIVRRDCGLTRVDPSAFIAIYRSMYMLVVVKCSQILRSLSHRQRGIQ